MEKNAVYVPKHFRNFDSFLFNSNRIIFAKLDRRDYFRQCFWRYRLNFFWDLVLLYYKTVFLINIGDFRMKSK